MKWRDRKQSSNVEDRRSSSGGLGSSGRGLPSIGTLMFLWTLVKPLLRSKLGLAVVGVGAAAYFFMPSLMGGGSSKPVSEAADDEHAAFIKTVMGDTEVIWGKIFAQAGERYPAAKLVLYRGGTRSGCGPASAGMGPFYCPEDKKVYVDLSFFDSLKSKHWAGGDFAQAYVLAH
jgi:predicted metalloprotease